MYLGIVKTRNRVAILGGDFDIKIRLRIKRHNEVIGNSCLAEYIHGSHDRRRNGII